MNYSSSGVDIVALFDGDCIMCNNFVRALDKAKKGSCNSLILTSDPKKFVSLTGHNFDEMIVRAKSSKTILVYVTGRNNDLLERGMAIARLLIATKSKKMIVLGKLILVVPAWITNPAYDIISRYRRMLPLKSCSLKKLEWLILDE